MREPPVAEDERDVSGPVAGMASGQRFETQLSPQRTTLAAQV